MPSSDSGDSHLLNYSTYLLLENKTMTRLPLREVVYMGVYMWVPSGSVVKNLPATQETRVRSLGREDPLERKWQPTPVFLPGESDGQRSLGSQESDN